MFLFLGFYRTYPWLLEALVKKDGTRDLGKVLLEEVVKSYFTANESRVPAIRNSEDKSVMIDHE